MSKAFTRESDDEADWPVMTRQSSPLPAGAKNYLTPNGARRLREELERLVEAQRAGAIAAREQDSARQQVQRLNQRVLHLHQSLESAVVVAPPAPPWEQVRFGATVTVRESEGVESRYRIVGCDETDLDRGWVSWLSPIAKALVNARLGQRIRFKSPSGEEELEVIGIQYE